MKFYRNGIEYTVLNCTAVAACDHGDLSKGQRALVVYADNGTETAKHIVFGWDMPETETDFNDMCEDAGAWEAAGPGHKMTL